MKLSGQKAQIFIDSLDNTAIIEEGSTTAGQKYFVIGKGTGSNVPVDAGAFFIAPHTGTQIELVEGDKLFKIDEDRICKTSASFEFSMGTVDVGDDCDPGATISDGILQISGSLAGLLKYDDVTQEFCDVTQTIINRFLDIVEDDGAGTYTITERDDSQIYMLTLLNSGAKDGAYENWLFVPINISSMSVSLGNSDAQNRDLSFTKGEGAPIIYKVKTKKE